MCQEWKPDLKTEEKERSLQKFTEHKGAGNQSGVVGVAAQVESTG